MKTIFSLSRRADRIFLSLYILWTFTNVMLLTMGTPSGKQTYYHTGTGQFTVYDYRQYFYPFNGDLQKYDYTEMLLYGLAPLILFVVFRLIFTGGQKPTE
jgi:hypothetical protein